MITFLICIAVLIGVCFTYRNYIEKAIGVDEQRATPSITKNDGVDYMPLKWGKIFFIKF